MAFVQNINWTTIVGINRNTPGKVNDAGAVDLRVLRSVKEEEELLVLKGCPDLVVFSPPAPASSPSIPAPPVLTLVIVENKKTAKPLKNGRDCQLGQALFYASGHTNAGIGSHGIPPLQYSQYSWLKGNSHPQLPG